MFAVSTEAWLLLDDDGHGCYYWRAALPAQSSDHGEREESDLRWNASCRQPKRLKPDAKAFPTSLNPEIPNKP